MKRNFLYILLLIAAWIGGANVVCGQEAYYVVDVPDEKEVMTSGSSSKTQTYDFTAPGQTLTFQARDNSSLATGRYEVCVYDASGNELSKTDFTAGTSWETKTIDNLPVDARRVSIKGTGTLKKLVRNVLVTRATTFSATPSSFKWDLLLLNEVKSGTINVLYSNTYKNQTLKAVPSGGVSVEQNSWSMVDEGSISIPFSFSGSTLGPCEGSVVLTRNDVQVATIVFSASVGKKTPTFNFSLNNTYSSHIYKLSDFFSTDSPCPYSFASSDEGKAIIVDGKLYVHASSGEFEIVVSQQGNDTWYEKQERYRISVQEGSATAYAEQQADFDIWQTGEKTLSLSFPSSKITYTAQGQTLFVDYGVDVSSSSDHGTSWQNIAERDVTTSAKSFEEPLQRGTTHVRFGRKGASTLNVYFRNIYIYMASYMTPDHQSVTFDRTMVGRVSEVKNITVDWSGVEDYINNLKVMCDNPNFVVSVVNNPCTPANQTWGNSNQRWGQSTISVSYTPQEVGAHTANLYFYDNKRFITIPVSGEAYSPLELTTNVNPSTLIYGENEFYSLVYLDRALPAGYFTMTLPFDYNISEIEGAYAAQLAQVTYNVADGYTLYFEKKMQMNANQPYVVYLKTPINAPQWADVYVSKPVEASIDVKGWTMQANYTPGLSMEGKYGIAGGKLCIGTATSTINAYTAYFVPPTSAKAQVRMAVMDDEGGVTYIGNVAAESDMSGSSVFRLDGVRLNGLGKGVNIVRMSDGTVRKVLK